MEFKEILEKIKSLNLPSDQYALFGSAPMIVRGIRNFSHDVDIIVSEKIWKEYSEKKDWELKSFEHSDRVVYLIEHKKYPIELFRDWGPGNWNTEELIKNADLIDGLPFVRLEDVLKWKKINNRQKDLEDVGLIGAYLK